MAARPRLTASDSELGRTYEDSTIGERHDCGGRTLDPRRPRPRVSCSWTRCMTRWSPPSVDHQASCVLTLHSLRVDSRPRPPAPGRGGNPPPSGATSPLPPAPRPATPWGRVVSSVKEGDRSIDIQLIAQTVPVNRRGGRAGGRAGPTWGCKGWAEGGPGGGRRPERPRAGLAGSTRAARARVHTSCHTCGHDRRHAG